MHRLARTIAGCALAAISAQARARSWRRIEKAPAAVIGEALDAVRAILE
jgi:hypothetical protein